MPEYASFDIFNITKMENLTECLSVDDKSQLVNIDHMIRSVAFFDKWFLDAENFTLSKEVVRYCPIRLHQRQKDVTGYAPIHRIPLGIIRFPEEKRKQYFLPGKKRKIYDLYWDHPVDIKRISEELFGWEYELSDDELIDPGPHEIIVDEEYIANDLKGNIYSLIFFEEWSLDTSSLFIHKKVTAVAPVYWKTETDESTGEVYVDKSTGDPVYTKIPMFKIYFNSYD